MVAKPAASSHSTADRVSELLSLYGTFFPTALLSTFFYFLDFTRISGISKCWVSVRRQGAGISHNLFGIPAKRPPTLIFVVI